MVEEKDETVHRFAARGELKEREKEGKSDKVTKREERKSDKATKREKVI